MARNPLAVLLTWSDFPIQVDYNTPVPSKQRGRPPKFGRPAQLVALTLPQDILRGLPAGPSAVSLPVPPASRPSRVTASPGIVTLS